MSLSARHFDAALRTLLVHAAGAQPQLATFAYEVPCKTVSCVVLALAQHVVVVVVVCRRLSLLGPGALVRAPAGATSNGARGLCCRARRSAGVARRSCRRGVVADVSVRGDGDATPAACAATADLVPLATARRRASHRVRQRRRRRRCDDALVSAGGCGDWSADVAARRLFGDAIVSVHCAKRRHASNADESAEPDDDDDDDLRFVGVHRRRCAGGVRATFALGSLVGVPARSAPKRRSFIISTRRPAPWRRLRRARRRSSWRRRLRESLQAVRLQPSLRRRHRSAPPQQQPLRPPRPLRPR